VRVDPFLFSFFKDLFFQKDPNCQKLNIEHTIKIAPELSRNNHISNSYKKENNFVAQSFPTEVLHQAQH